MGFVDAYHGQISIVFITTHRMQDYVGAEILCCHVCAMSAMHPITERSDCLLSILIGP